MTYQEQLLDPRWQKRRLEILNRDSFTCQYCDDTKSTLNVHHLFYEKDIMAWDAKGEHLLTLCDECHQEFHTEMPQHHKVVVDNMKMKLKDTFITSCAAKLFSSVTNLHDLIYLLWELKDEEDNLIELLREEFQKRKEILFNSIECHESEV